MFNGHDNFTKIFYQKNHRDFNFCDCYGICYLFNKEVLNKEIPEYLNEKIYDNEDVVKTYNSKKPEFTKVNTGREKAGDIVSLKVKSMPIHVGVVIEKGAMLHIMENRHAVIESYNTNKWKNKVDSFWRYEDTK